jgi:hypothetical protein
MNTHMKPQYYPCLVALVLCSLSRLAAQEPDPAVETKSPIIPLASDISEIVGPLPAGTPSTPAEPKPRLVFEQEDLRKVTVRTLGQRVITFEKVAPITLPPIPDPQPQAKAEPSQAFLHNLPESKKRQFVFLGASAYQFSDSEEHPRSFERFWPTPGGKPVSLWINANLLWITGFGEFETAEVHYSLLMVITPVNVERLASLAAQAGREHALPEIPEFTDESTASIIVVEGNPTENELAPIRSLAALYNTDKDRLKGAYMGRMKLAEEQARKVRENPPEKKNIVLRYWRLDAAGQNETAKPATIR